MVTLTFNIHFEWHSTSLTIQRMVKHVLDNVLYNFG